MILKRRSLSSTILLHIFSGSSTPNFLSLHNVPSMLLCYLQLHLWTNPLMDFYIRRETILSSYRNLRSSQRKQGSQDVQTDAHIPIRMPSKTSENITMKGMNHHHPKPPPSTLDHGVNSTCTTMFRINSRQKILLFRSCLLGTAVTSSVSMGIMLAHAAMGCH